MLKLQKLFQRMQSQKGAAKIEYVLLVALISVVAIGSLTSVGDAIKAQFDTVEGHVSGAGAAGGGTT